MHMTEIFDLFHNVKITKCAAATASNQTDVEGTPVDMQGYEGAVFFGTIGTANAGNYLKVRQGTDSTVTDAADLEGTKVVATAAAEIVWCEIYKPQERYLQPYIEKGGAATTTGDLYCIQYGGRKGMETNITTDVIIGERHISPSEGTA
jgi:hypothetical protein